MAYRLTGELNGEQRVMIRFKCGEMCIQAYGWNGQHLLEQFTFTCKDCNSRPKIFSIDCQEV